MYSDIKLAVKWQEGISQIYRRNKKLDKVDPPQQTATRENKVLKQLDSTPSMKIGHFNTGALMVADDLPLVA